MRSVIAVILFVSVVLCGNKIDPRVNRSMHSCARPTVEKLTSEAKAKSDFQFIRIQCGESAANFHCSNAQQTTQADVKSKINLPDCATKDSAVVTRMFDLFCTKNDQVQIRKPSIEPNEPGKMATKVGSMMLKNLPQIDLDDYAQVVVDKAKEMSKKSACKKAFPLTTVTYGIFLITKGGVLCASATEIHGIKKLESATAHEIATAYSAKLKAAMLEDLIESIWDIVFKCYCRIPMKEESFKKFSDLEATLRKPVACVSTEPLISM